ncbi:MAG: tetratricopeptide repeat protein [Phycisphaerales bacterium]
MKSTLTTLAILCAIVWGGTRAWHAYRNVSPVERAHWCMEGGEYDSAIPLLEQARAEEPDNLEIDVQLAECHDRMGDKATAAKLYKAARPVLNDPEAPPSMEYHRDRLATLESLGY